jgi:serine/threonine protein kinase
MGHAHITDFNVAIHYSERRLHTSVAGSMAYMAPQVVNKKGYTWHIDWWSLGVTAFELIFHKRPFDGRNSEKMTHSILKDPLRFPDDANRRCSEEGIMALKGVSLHRNLETVLLTDCLSSLTVIPRHGLGVDRMDVVSRISDNTLGSLVLTGTALRARSANHSSSLTYVVFAAHLTCHCFLILFPR